jgi:hypothetical protein
MHASRVFALLAAAAIVTGPLAAQKDDVPPFAGLAPWPLAALFGSTT